MARRVARHVIITLPATTNARTAQQPWKRQDWLGEDGQMYDIIIAQLSKLLNRDIEKLHSICRDMMSERMMGGAAKILRGHISSAAVAMFRRYHETAAVVLYTTGANGTSDVYVHIAVTRPDRQQRGICRMLLAQLLVEHTKCATMHLESAVDMVDICDMDGTFWIPIKCVEIHHGWNAFCVCQFDLVNETRS
jgi:hypothetical protein